MDFLPRLAGGKVGRNNCVACVIFCRSTELECFAILTEQYDGLGVLQLEHTEGFARESQHAELFWTNAFHSWGGCAACNAHSTVGKAKPAMYGRFLSPRHKLLKDERIHNPLATKRSSSPRRDVVSFSSQPPRSAGDRWLWHYDNLIQSHLLEFTIVRGLSDGIPQGDLSVAKQTNLVCFDVFRIKANKEGSQSITPLSFHRQSV